MVSCTQDSDYNYIYGTLPTTEWVEGSNTLYVDPKVNPDGTLQADSPCIESGVDLGYRGLDVHGNPAMRWRKVDMGAVKYQHAANPRQVAATRLARAA